MPTMETPSALNQVKDMYLIDHLKAGNVWYLWTVKDGEWVTLKTGDWKTIVKELEKREEGDENRNTVSTVQP